MMRAIGAAVGIFNSRCLERAFYASPKKIFTILLYCYNRCRIMQHACGDFQQIRPIRQLRLKMRKRGLPDISTFDPVDHRRLLRFHTARMKARQRGRKNRGGPEKEPFPVENRRSLAAIARGLSHASPYAFNFRLKVFIPIPRSRTVWDLF